MSTRFTIYNYSGQVHYSVLIDDISVWIDNVAQCSECTILNSLGFATTIASKTYVVTHPIVTTEAYRTNLGVACFGIPNYSLSYNKNGETIAGLPTWLTHDLTTHTLTYHIPDGRS